MYKIINLSVFVLIVLFTSKVHAAQKSMSLHPSEAKVLTNSSPFDLNATCTIQMNGQKKAVVRVRVLKNNCSVNGKHLKQGQATSVSIKNHSNIAVSAEAGTQINLENKGAQEMLAVCSS